jgi:hypothetical protein
MAIRIKSTWHESDRNASLSKSMADHGGALAFIVWRLALENAKELHKEGFQYDSDRERVGIITEFVAFSVQVIDRLAYTRIANEQRHTLINSLGQNIAAQVQDNLTEIAGPGSYRHPFIDLLNRRLGEYARLSFEDDQPGFDFLRFFGKCTLDIMGDTQTNRWVIDQVMAIAAPELLDQIKRSVDNLLGSPLS